MLSLIVVTVLIILSYVILAYLEAYGNTFAHFMLDVIQIMPVMFALQALGWNKINSVANVLLAIFLGAIIGEAQSRGRKHKESLNKLR